MMEKVISLKNLHEDARLQSSLMSNDGHELQLTSNTEQSLSRGTKTSLLIGIHFPLITNTFHSVNIYLKKIVQCHVKSMQER